MNTWDDFDDEVVEESVVADEDSHSSEAGLSLINEEAKEKLRHLCDARDVHDAAKTAAASAKKALDEIEMEVYSMFEDIENDGENAISGTLTVPLGPGYGTVKFKTRATHYATITDPDALYEYYENRAQSDEVSAPKFVMKRLNTEVRGIVDHNGKLPPGLTYYTNRGMTITRPK